AQRSRTTEPLRAEPHHFTAADRGRPGRAGRPGATGGAHRLGNRHHPGRPDDVADPRPDRPRGRADYAEALRLFVLPVGWVESARPTILGCGVKRRGGPRRLHPPYKSRHPEGWTPNAERPLVLRHCRRPAPRRTVVSGSATSARATSCPPRR